MITTAAALSLWAGFKSSRLLQIVALIAGLVVVVSVWTVGGLVRESRVREEARRLERAEAEVRALKARNQVLLIATARGMRTAKSRDDDLDAQKAEIDALTTTLQEAKRASTGDPRTPVLAADDPWLQPGAAAGAKPGHRVGGSQGGGHGVVPPSRAR